MRLPRATAGAEHVFHLHVVRASEADELVARLAGAGVAARGYYRTPVHRQPPMRRFAGEPLPVTDEIAATNLALPMGPRLTPEQVEPVVAACRARAVA